MKTLDLEPQAGLKTQVGLPIRPRRLRTTGAMRDLVAETHLEPRHFIAPFFVVPGQGEVQPVSALPGVSRMSADTLLRELERALTLGIRSAVLFGVVPQENKSASGASACDVHGPVVQALREARKAFGNDLVLITDVCLCGYTDHGHCGVLKETPRGIVIDNDASLQGLADMALAHAKAGADMVSPSDMMDGRVGYLRQALDEGGHTDVGILSYAVKYASAFYGPFREAAGSAPKGASADPRAVVPPSDRKTYQMDGRNTREALREASLDEAEGADMLMVKPALPYLDILARLRPRTNLPLVAYNVSGEYAMIKAAVNAGVLDEPLAVRETLMGVRRAGADLIISYHALEALEQGWL
jgi:porphobilinogen synthase